MTKRFYANRLPMSMLSSKNFSTRVLRAFAVAECTGFILDTKVDPPFDGLSADSLFADLLQRLNFQWVFPSSELCQQKCGRAQTALPINSLSSPTCRRLVSHQPHHQVPVLNL